MSGDSFPWTAGECLTQGGHHYSVEDGVRRCFMCGRIDARPPRIGPKNVSEAPS